MATWTHEFNTVLMLNILLILLFFTTQLLAQTDEQILDDWTKNSEQQLIEKYDVIESQWFEEECMLLAKKMEFTKISQCTLFQSKYINAYVFNNGHVYFSLGLMQHIRNRHQWASILAHENAHIELKHYLKNIKKIKKPGVFFPKTAIRKTLKKHEKEADDWSQQRLSTFGFDNDQIHFFLQRVKRIKTNKNNSTHLKLNKRIKKIKVNEIINLELIEKISLIKPVP